MKITDKMRLEELRLGGVWVKRWKFDGMLDIEVANVRSTQKLERFYNILDSVIIGKKLGTK